MGRPLWMSRVYYWIMVNNDDSVARRVDVELDAIRSQFDRPGKRSKRVLRMRLVCASVGDSLRRIASSAYVQAFLSVVALSWMSAKL